MALKPRIVTCIISGLPIEYKGFGRPPLYHPSVRKEAERRRRKAARERNALAAVQSASAAVAQFGL